jgi:YbbR domain-containing protein
LKIHRKILNFLGSRNGIRLVSVLAAIIVWYTIQAATSNTTFVSDIPLAVQPPPGWIVMDQSADTVDVAFLGSRDDLRYLSRELIKATVDVRDHDQNGAFEVALGPGNINAPSAARIDFIRPTTLTLRLDREITKQVPVKVETQNLLPDGYEIEQMVVTPAMVELSGPAQRLAELESVNTIPVDLDGRIRSMNKRKLVLVPNSRMTGVELHPEAVTLDLTIVERSVSEQFDDLPIHPLLPAGRELLVEVDPEVATLKVKGRPTKMKKLTADDLRVYVDATQVSGSKATKLPIRAILPDGITLVRAAPSKATVKVSEK